MASATVPSKKPAQSRHEQVLATHSPDAREFDVQPLLLVVEDVFNRVNPGITSIVQKQGSLYAQKALDMKTHQEGFHEIINKIVCEMSCKCSGGEDGHETTLAILNIVSSYKWDAKVVLALAALAVNYGEFWLVRQFYFTNPLARAVAFLKQFSGIVDRLEVLQPKFDALNNNIKEMVKVTKFIVDIEKLASQYIIIPDPDTIEAVYWTIRSIVTCASQFIGLIGVGHEHTAPSKDWKLELPSLADVVSIINNHLVKQGRHIGHSYHSKYQESHLYIKFNR